MLTVRGTYSDCLDLEGTLVDSTIDRRARVSLCGRAAADLCRVVDVDREEAFAGVGLPLSDKRLAACIPRQIGWVDTAWVEPKGD